MIFFESILSHNSAKVTRCLLTPILRTESQYVKKKNRALIINTFLTSKQVAVAYAYELDDRYKPQRTLKRQKTAVPSVQQTLLEYGKLNRMSKTQTEKKPQSEKAAKLEAKLSSRQLEQPEEDDAAAEERRISGMIKSMDSVESKKINVKGIISCAQR